MKQDVRQIEKASRIVDIPIEYFSSFELDPTAGWIEFGDTALDSDSPYFEDREAVRRIINKKRKNPFDSATMSFSDDFYCDEADDNFRFMHIDMGHTRDACGMAMSHIIDWVRLPIRRKIDGKVHIDEDIFPVHYVDFIADIRVPEGETEIIFQDIRKIIYELDRRGYPLALITFDGFESVDMTQLLRKRDFIVAHLSLDRTSNYPVLMAGEKNGFKKVPTTSLGKLATLSAWSCTKQAVNTGRLDCPVYEIVSSTAFYDDAGYNPQNVDDMGNILENEKVITLIEEQMFGATFDADNFKVRESVGGSIDMLEALAGSIFNASNNVTIQEEVESGLEKRRRLGRELSGAKTEMERKDILDEMYPDAEYIDESDTLSSDDLDKHSSFEDD